MSERLIIGFAGLMGAGKSTAALHLCEEHNFRRVPFAGPLKEMLRALGLSHDEVYGAGKERPCELLGGRTPRHAMQTLGTEWGRQLVDRDLWLRAWRRAVDEVPEGVGVVADDVRFANEVAAIRSASAHARIVRLYRPLPPLGIPGAHVSELQSFAVDDTIANAGSLAELTAAIDALLMGELATENAGGLDLASPPQNSVGDGPC